MSELRVLWPGVVAAAIIVTDGLFYAALIQRQGDPRPVVPVVLTALTATTVAVLGASLRPHNRATPVLLAVGGACLFVLGVVGIFSIGLPLLVASGFCFAALLTRHPGRKPLGRWSAAGVIGLTVASLAVTGWYLVQLGSGGSTVKSCIEISGRSRASHHPNPPARQVRCHP